MKISGVITIMALASITSAFQLVDQPRVAPHMMARNRFTGAFREVPVIFPVTMIAPETDSDNWFDRLVLLRPSGCDECAADDDQCAVEPHVLGTTCETERVPGTLRTTIFSSLLCILIAIPLLLANPAVLPKLVEVSTPVVCIPATSLNHADVGMLCFGSCAGGCYLSLRCRPKPVTHLISHAWVRMFDG